MDPLDVRIIATMGIYPYGQWPHSPERLQATFIARKLREPVATVKSRIARMESEGVIAGYQVTPNFRHLGLKPTAYLLRPGSGDVESGAGEAVLATEGVLEVHDFHGHGLCVLFAYEDSAGLHHRLEGFRRCTGEARPVLFHDWNAPLVERPLTRLDWRILGALRWNAKASPYAVAERLGVAGRTVRRRLDRMVAEGSVAFTVLFDPTKVSGFVPFVLALHFERERDAPTVRRILDAFEDRCIHYDATATAELGQFALLLFADDLAEVEELTRRGEGIRGVRRAEPWLVRRQWGRFDWLDRRIGELGREVAAEAESPGVQIRQAT